jgi:RNA polymerase sigma factor (sigma-70 family)
VPDTAVLMDSELVIRAQGGDEAAFAAITAASYGRLQQVAYRILRDRHLAEDATQQALVNVWRKLPTLKDPAKFEAWSYRFLVNACSAEARRDGRSPRDLPFARELVASDDVNVVLDRDQLERGFERLTVDQRAVVVLHHYLDLTLDDTAAALGISVGTVNSRLGRAMAKLRLALHVDRPMHEPVPGEVTR